MPKILRSILFLCVLILLVVGLPLPVTYSDELDDLNKQIGDLTTALNQSIAATKPLESQLTAIQTQITGIKNRVTTIESDMAVKKKISRMAIKT